MSGRGGGAPDLPPGAEKDAGQFCPCCDVSMDLHVGPDSCALAERKAHMLELVAKAERSARREWGF